MVVPKYVQTQRAMMDYITANRLTVGSPLPTELALARRFGVSLITVRRAMGALEERRIVRREQGRGSFVADGIQSVQMTGTIAFLDIFKESLTIPTYGPSIVNLDNSLAKRGYQLRLVAAGREPSPDITRLLVDVEGVLATGWINQAWLRLLDTLSMPLVIIGSVTGDYHGLPTVVYDWREMAERLVHHQADRGARRLGLITGSAEYAPSQDMRAGFLAALRARGLPADPHQVLFPDDRRKAADVAAFLDARGESFDGLLVEVGNGLHVLSWLLHRRCRPRLSVLSVQPQLGQVFAAFDEGSFADDIYEAGIRLLFAVADPAAARPASVRLPPTLITHRGEVAP
jgi:DNA-binding LacI/PurR family transcriptional regulator